MRESVYIPIVSLCVHVHECAYNTCVHMPVWAQLSVYMCVSTACLCVCTYVSVQEREHCVVCTCVCVAVAGVRGKPALRSSLVAPVPAPTPQLACCPGHTLLPVHAFAVLFSGSVQPLRSQSSAS